MARHLRCSSATATTYGGCACTRTARTGCICCLLVEFQSTDDPLMALRIHTYTGLLYQELARNGQLDADGRLPAVLPLVLYNGDEPWVSPLQMGELIAPVGPSLAPYQPAQRYFVLDERRVQADDLPRRNRMSAVIALEQSRSPRDVARVADMLAAWLPALQVRRAFADWMRQIVERLVPSGVELPPIRKLEDVSMTLVERAAEWSREWLKEGLQQGIEQGIAAHAPPAATARLVRCACHP